MTLLFLLVLVQGPTVGMPRRIDDLVIAGTEIVAKPLTDTRSPIVLRILNTAKHGTAYRYDIVYHGLAPGTYDLRQWLQRKDGSSMDDVPAIPVEIRPAYAGEMREVSDPVPGAIGLLGGYRAAVAVGLVVWAVALLLIIVLTRRPKPKTDVAQKPVTLADRLRPMVEKAARGSLTRDEQAALERMLLAFWRKCEGLDGMDVADALAELRRRETPGALLRALEEWLHRPGPAREVDVPALLAPYSRSQL